LFADGLSVFRLPTAIRAIINKMAETKDDGKKVRVNDVDDSSTANQKNSQRKERETRNTRAIFGDKLYGNEIDKIVSDALNFGVNQNVVPTIVSDYMESVIAEPIAKWSETYNVPKSEVKAKVEETKNKVYEIVDGYISPDMTNKNKNDLVSELSDFILEELPKDTVGNSEDALNKKEDDAETNILISKLKTFSRAIPILVMASENPEELNIHNIEKAVDEQTFIEIFTERHGNSQTLHQPFTIEDFKRLRDGGTYEEKDGTIINFEGCFNTYAVNASIKEFIEKRKKIANYLDPSIKEDIFAYIAPQKSNQIFTPRRVINQMLNILEEENPEIFSNPNITFCDLYIKSGMFLTEIAKRLDRGLADQIPDQKARIKHIFENQLYGFTPSKVIDAVARSFIYGVADYVSEKNLIQKDLTPDFKEGKTLNMKFDVVIGNPPYQEDSGKTKQQSQGNTTWIYYYFQNQAENIADRTVLIYPFGGWFDSPKSFQGFGRKILSDGHTVSIDAYEGTSDKRAWYRTDKDPKPIFDGANLSAGVSIVVRDMRKIHDTYTYSNRVYSDNTRVVGVDEWEILSPSPDFSFANKLLGDKLSKRIKKGIFGIESNFVENNPNKVSFNKDDWRDPIILYTNDKAGSTGRAKKYWANRSIIEKGNDSIDKYKVVATSAYPKKTFASGMPTVENVQRRLSELVEILPKGSAFGRSKLALFMSSKKENCENFVKYTQTRFFAYLVLQEPNRSSSIGYVIPDQNFTASSDIDWSQSISEIDRQLYKKYGLSEQEIAFIEERVRAME
jgi:hypothetical protein